MLLYHNFQADHHSMIIPPHISAWHVAVHLYTNPLQEDCYDYRLISYKDSLQRVLLFALQPVLIFFRQSANRKFPVLLQLDLRYWLDYDTIVAKDDDKEKFKVILNTLTNLYEASKPEIFEKNWSNDKFAPLVYLHGLFYHTIDDEKVARARQKMNQILDGSVTASQDFVNYVREEPAQYMIKGTKAIDLSKVDVEQLRKEIKVAKYKAIEINDLKEYIEQALEQMLNRNCTRTKFSERFKRIIDSYNAGGTENEDYYEQLVKLLEELRQEDKHFLGHPIYQEYLNRQ